MKQDVFQEIRGACRELAQRATHVKIQPDRIVDYASSLPIERAIAPTLDPTTHYLGEPRDTLAFFLTLDTINFGSGYFPHLRKRPGMSGYFTVASSLKERWERNGPLSGAELRAIDTGDCALLFGQEGNTGPTQELMALFAQALNDLGTWLGRRYDDDPLGPIEDAGQSAGRLVELVSEMPFFRDVSIYEGTEVPLYKRAQILVTDLAIAFDGQGPGSFR